jgi:hypothetical protein
MAGCLWGYVCAVVVDARRDRGWHAVPVGEIARRVAPVRVAGVEDGGAAAGLVEDVMDALELERAVGVCTRPGESRRRDRQSAAWTRMG